MDNPDDDLRKFIRDYYYSDVSEEAVAIDSCELLKFMREHGWEFSRIPDEW